MLVAVPAGVWGGLDSGAPFGILLFVLMLLHPVARVGAALMEVWEAELEARRAGRRER